MIGWQHLISNLVASLIININLPKIVEDITQDIVDADNLFAHAGYLVSKIVPHIHNTM